MWSANLTDNEELAATYLLDARFDKLEHDWYI